MPTLPQLLKQFEQLEMKASFKVTKVSGYVDTPEKKQCQTCKFSVEGGFCKNKVVLKDPEVKLAKNGLKKINPVNGCCNEWSPR